MGENEQILFYQEGECVGSWEVIKEVFYPIVHIGLSMENSDTIKNNSIIKHFNDSDFSNVRCQPFIKEMEEYTHLPDDQKYYVPYLRMWNSQKEDRIFKLQCYVSEGKDNYADEGDIYIEMPKKVSGLSINNLEDNTIKAAALYESFTLELLLTKDADRAPTGIDDVPLVFYVENNGEKMEVGRIHLSVAPKDVFSQEEIDIYLGKYKIVQDKINNQENYCLPAFREALETLLDIRSKKTYNTTFNTYTKNYNDYRIHTYANVLISLEYATHHFSTDYNHTTAATFKYSGKEYNYGKSNMPTQMIDSVLKKCLEESNEIGYHIFGMSIVFGSHVMSIVFNNINLINPKFTLSDHHVNGSKEYSKEDLDYAIDTHTLGTWKYAYVVKKNDSSSRLDLWKIKNY